MTTTETKPKASATAEDRDKVIERITADRDAWEKRSARYEQICRELQSERNELLKACKAAEKELFKHGKSIAHFGLLAAIANMEGRQAQ